MGKVTLFQIELYRNKTAYNLGDSIIGRVLIKLRHEIKVKYIKVRLYGCAYTHTNTKNRSVIERELNNSYELEKFCDQSITIYHGGSEDDDEYGRIVSGRHTFPFTFQLPIENLPSSLEYSSNCYIRYRVEASAERSKKRQLTTKRGITIQEIIDVNLPFLTRAKEPVKRQRDVGYFMWKTGPLRATGSLDRYGYCRGEKIIINIKIENFTNRTIPNVKAKLVQDIHYTARGIFKHHHQDLVVVRYDRPIPHGSIITWVNDEITIPNVSPTIKCSIIELRYFIKISIKVRLGFNLCFTMPVVVGTIPLNPFSIANSFQRRCNSSSSSSSGSNSSCSSCTSSSWNSTPESIFYNASGESGTDQSGAYQSREGARLRIFRFRIPRTNHRTEPENNLPPSYDACIASKTTINDNSEAIRDSEEVPNYDTLTKLSSNPHSSFNHQ